MNVLIADRSKTGWKRVKKLLEEIAGVETSGCDLNGADALNQIEGLRPDVLIFDVDIPVSKGLEVLRGIRRKHSPPVVIVLTDASCAHFRRLCLESGAAFFFDKATEYHKVAPAVEDLLEKSQGSPDHAVSVNNP